MKLAGFRNEKHLLALVNGTVGDLFAADGDVPERLGAPAKKPFGQRGLADIWQGESGQKPHRRPAHALASGHIAPAFFDLQHLNRPGIWRKFTDNRRRCTGPRPHIEHIIARHPGNPVISRETRRFLRRDQIGGQKRDNKKNRNTCLEALEEHFSLP